MLDYKKVQLEFLNEAPIRIKLKTQLAISADDLFDMFEDPNGWGWASIKSVVWDTPKPFGAGKFKNDSSFTNMGSIWRSGSSRVK